MANPAEELKSAMNCPTCETANFKRFGKDRKGNQR